jgi:hypothetical protein
MYVFRFSRARVVFVFVRIFSRGIVLSTRKPLSKVVEDYIYVGHDPVASAP